MLFRSTAAPMEYAKLKKRCPRLLEIKSSSLISNPLFRLIIYILSFLFPTFVAIIFLSSCKSDMGSDASETNEAALLVLVFPHAYIAPYIVRDIFPRPAAHNLSFEFVGIVRCCMISVFRIDV